MSIKVHEDDLNLLNEIRANLEQVKAQETHFQNLYEKAAAMRIACEQGLESNRLRILMKHGVTDVDTEIEGTPLNVGTPPDPEPVTDISTRAKARKRQA